jgi:hypothetical protein
MGQTVPAQPNYASQQPRTQMQITAPQPVYYSEDDLAIQVYLEGKAIPNGSLIVVGSNEEITLVPVYDQTKVTGLNGYVSRQGKTTPLDFRYPVLIQGSGLIPGVVYTYSFQATAHQMDAAGEEIWGQPVILKVKVEK